MSRNFLARDKVLEFLDKILHEISDASFPKQEFQRNVVEELKGNKLFPSKP